MIELLNNSDPDAITAEFLKDWFSKLRNMSTFKKNENAIRALYEMLRASTAQLGKLDREIKKNWLTQKKFFVDF
jgi:hypothetical protein